MRRRNVGHLEFGEFFWRRFSDFSPARQSSTSMRRAPRTADPVRQERRDRVARKNAKEGASRFGESGALERGAGARCRGSVARSRRRVANRIEGTADKRDVMSGEQFATTVSCGRWGAVRSEARDRPDVRHDDVGTRPSARRPRRRSSTDAGRNGDIGEVSELATAAKMISERRRDGQKG